MAAGHTEHDGCHGTPVGEQPEQVLVVASRARVEPEGVGLAVEVLHRSQEDLDPRAEPREILVVGGAIGKYALTGAHAADHGDGRAAPLEGKEPHAAVIDIPTAHRLEELGRGRLAPESKAAGLVALPSGRFQPQERVNSGSVGPHTQARARPEGGVQMQVVLAYRAAPVFPDTPQPVALPISGLAAKEASFPDVELDEEVFRLDGHLPQ